MSIYYIKQDNTVWCCEEDSGPYQEQIEETFVKCECKSVWAGKDAEFIADHLQRHAGGGEILKWRVAKGTELAAWYSGGDDAFQEGIAFEQERIIKLLEARADQAMRDGQGKPMPERMEYLAVEISIRQVAALIKEEQK